MLKCRHKKVHTKNEWVTTDCGHREEKTINIDYDDLNDESKTWLKKTQEKFYDYFKRDPIGFTKLVGETELVTLDFCAACSKDIL